MLKNEIAECLVFLHNVRKVSISIVKEDGSLEKEFFVNADISNKSDEENLHTFICNVRENMRKNSSYACSVERKEFKYHLNIQYNNRSSQEWLVVLGFGFMDKSLIPIEIRTAYEEKQLALLPMSGVAFNLQNNIFTLNKEVQKTTHEKLSSILLFTTTFSYWVTCSCKRTLRSRS